MFVRNKTGVRQSCSFHQVSLPPDVWTDLPYEAAMHLWEQRLVDIRPEKPANCSKELIQWLSPFSMGDGYATAAENMVHALIALEQKLQISQCWFVVRDGLDPRTIELLDRKSTVPALVGICMATPGEFHKLPTPCKIGLTMYETDDPLSVHPEWRKQCNEVDLLIVPSEYCKKVFAQFVKVPIEVVPLAVNPIYYIGTTYVRPKRDTFTFVTHGTLSGRKSPLELISSFKKAFPKESDVRLILKTRNEICGYKEHQLPDIDDSRITIVSEDYYPDRMLQFLKDADAYVFPTKGEGYGLPPREAMATGLPTIFANNTGLIDLAWPTVNWPMPCTELVTSPIGGKWWSVDEEYLVESMRWIYENQEEAKQRGIAGAEWFIQNRGAEASARQLMKVLASFNTGKALRLQKKKKLVAMETLTNKAASRHKIFFDVASEKLKQTRGVVLDVGVSGGEGIAYVELTRRGHQVIGLVRPGTRAQVRKKLVAAGIKKPRLREVALPKLGSLRTNYIVSGCVCHSTLQAYSSMTELKKILTGMFSHSHNSHISVPTVYYPGHFSPEALLLRPEFWKDVLVGFAADFRLYGPDKCYIRVQLLEQIQREVRSKGRIIDGTWRQQRK